MDFTKEEYQFAHSVAYKCASNKTQREEIKSFLYLWMVENYKTIQRYRTEEGGADKLFTALRNAHYAGTMKSKRQRRPDLFEVSHEDNKRLRKQIGEDIESNKLTDAVSYIHRHKYRAALIDFFTGGKSLVKTARAHDIHQQALYRAKRNAMLIAREHDAHRYQ